MSISTHILDTALGRPAGGVVVSLEVSNGAAWTPVYEGRTDQDGRIKSLLPDAYGPIKEPATFRLRFATAPYFAAQNSASLYPYVDIVFQVEADARYHIPLLLTANGYTTYRGS